MYIIIVIIVTNMIVVLGSGMIGSVIARELSAKDDVVIIDKRKIENNILKVLTGDVFDFPEVLHKANVIVSALPGDISYNVISKLLSKGKKVVDVSFMPEDPMSLNDVATGEKSLLIPDAGYAPGLTNMISGYFFKKYDAQRIEIYDAGLPQRKVPPLDYNITWSVKGLIDLYTRPARFIRDGKIITVDPLENIERVNFPGIGELDAFLVDGLGTLLHTLKGVDIFEKTYRYPGHLQKIKFLRDMGYFSENIISGCAPRSVSEELFERKLKMDIDDLCILEIRAFGGTKKEVRYIDYYDKRRNDTSMARMTSFPAVAITELLIDGKIDMVGVQPPEYFGFEESTFHEILSNLRGRGLNIQIS